MQALVFVPLLALVSIVGWLLALHLAHYYLVVVESSAAGGDRVLWPDESLIDWFWKVFFLGYLAGIWVGPALILGRSAGDAATATLAAATFFGVMFPLSLLSSMGGPSRWLPLWPALVPRLGQRTAAVAGFYVRSVIPLGVGGASAWVLSGSGPAAAILPAAVLFAVCWLVHARLLGRLAFVLTFTTAPEPARKSEPDRPARPRRRRRERPETTEPEQPAVVRPSEAEPHRTVYGDAVGYDLTDAPPPPPDPVFVPAADEPEEEEPEAAPAATGQRRRRRRRRLRDVPDIEDRHLPEPKPPFDASMITFLFAPGSIMAVLRMSFGLALVGGVLRVMAEVRPE